LKNKQYLYTESEFIFQWADRWRQLFDLIFDLMHTGKSWAPTLPNELDEIRYQNLRVWLIDNEVTFLQLWKDFYTSKDWTLDTSNDLIEEIRDAERDLENPFLWFYGTEDLKEFFRVYVIDKQSGQPNEEQAWTIAMSLLQVDLIAVDFVLWICDGMGDNADLQ